MTALAVAVTVLVLRSRAGLLLRASRDNEERLRAAGHPMGRYLYLAYVGAGALGGIGRSLLVTVQRYVSPADVGFDLSALVMLAVVVGGACSLPGALAGAALIVGTRDWLAVPGPARPRCSSVPCSSPRSMCLAHWLSWSGWRRRHQARARSSHYQRQAHEQP